MIKTIVTNLNEGPMYFVQLEPGEKSDGVNFYWEYNGLRITHPNEYLSLIRDKILAGETSTQKMIQANSLGMHLNKVYQSQMISLKTQLQEMRSKLGSNPMMEDRIKQAESLIPNECPFTESGVRQA